MPTTWGWGCSSTGDTAHDAHVLPDILYRQNYDIILPAIEGTRVLDKVPMVWNGHCRDSASISSRGLQLCIFPYSWLQWGCDSRIYLLYLLLKFGLWYVVVLSNLTTFAQGYASFALELTPWLTHPVAASSDAPRGVGFPNFEFHHCGLPRKPKVGKVYGPWGIASKGETDLPKLFHYNFLQNRKIACLSQLHHRGKPQKSNKATKTGFLSSVEKRTQLDHVGPKVNKHIYIYYIILCCVIQYTRSTPKT